MTRTNLISSRGVSNHYKLLKNGKYRLKQEILSRHCLSSEWRRELSHHNNNYKNLLNEIIGRGYFQYTKDGKKFVDLEVEEWARSLQAAQSPPGLQILNSEVK